MELEEWITKVEQVDIGEIINAAIRKNEAKIIRLNTDKQLFSKGIDNIGSLIAPKYARSTIKYKQRKGQPTNRVTLRDSGRWQDKQFYIQYEKDQIIITIKPTLTSRSFDLTGHLLKRYGKEIPGLTTLNIDELREIILPDLIRAFQNLK